MFDLEIYFQTVLNFLLSLPCVNNRPEEQIQEFRDQKVPVFWVFGPPGCGKGTLVRQLMECTMFRVIRLYTVTSSLENTQIRPTSENVVEQLKKEIKETYNYVHGYIIEDFPRSISEAFLFERKICKVTVAIYVSLSLDAVLGRQLANEPVIDLNMLRIVHVLKTRNAKKIYKKYSRRNAAANIVSVYPSEETLKKCLEVLENDFGYKFSNKYIKHFMFL